MLIKLIICAIVCISKIQPVLAKTTFLYVGDTAPPPFPYKDSVNLIISVNKLINTASEKNFIIVYVKQEFEGVLGKLFSKLFCNITAIKGNPGAEIDKRINLISDNIFTKGAPDAFSNVSLETFLKENKVNDLYLTGLDAEFCVYATAKGALKHGYKVSVINDAIALRAEKKWNDLFKKYEMDGINIISSEDFQE